MREGDNDGGRGEEEGEGVKDGERGEGVGVKMEGGGRVWV